MSNRYFFSWRKLINWLVCALLLGLAACAQLPDQPVKTKTKDSALVFPPPPEEARFVFERVIYGSADVVPEKEESSLKKLVVGTTEHGGNDPLRKPYAVAVHRGRIFVSDTVARVVKVFDVPEGRYFTVGDSDPGRLMKPLGIDVDDAGTLYVADATTKHILIYDRDGKFLRQLGGPSMFDRLTSVTVDKKGERLYVVDIGGVSSENHRVRVMDAHSGNVLFDIGKRGNGPGELNLPRDVAIGKGGSLYVVDGANFRIQVFDSNGKYLRNFGQVGKQYGSFARPKEASTDANGNLYVIDAAFGNFQIFSPDDDLLLFIGDRSAEDGPAQYMLPSGIYVDEDGRVYMVDQWFHKLEVYRPAALAPQDGYLGKKHNAETSR
ncbi:MAG TPA: 6-bladed beta-propeller [Novimethylophilus sp.]|jgi:hypothetical protein|uniref:6-bladed beta-propeller n=1 Tax=Novimethylophilus sp. TaxID=2137426 RepID=UPI002F41E22C